MDELRFAEAVRTAAAAWRWVPYDATTVTTAAAVLAVSNRVARVHRTAPPADWSTPQFVTEVRRLAAAHGATSLTWTVPDHSHPADLGDALAAQGSTIVEDHEVMAHALDVGPPAVDSTPDIDIDVRRVDTPDLLEEAYAIDSAVLGTPVRSARFRQIAVATLAEQVAAGPARTAYRFLALVDGAPAATAGLTFDGPTARLWGAAVLAGHRGRGIYRALLAARLTEATARGAALALAKARTGTSAPILHRVGFRTYGRERHHRLATQAADSPP